MHGWGCRGISKCFQPKLHLFLKQILAKIAEKRDPNTLKYLLFFTKISQRELFLIFSCPKYSNLPTGCYETKKAGECCSSVQCDSGTILTSTNNLGTIGSGGLITVKNPNQPQIIPTVPGGGNPQPGTGGTGMTAPTLRMLALILL